MFTQTQTVSKQQHLSRLCLIKRLESKGFLSRSLSLHAANKFTSLFPRSASVFFYVSRCLVSMHLTPSSNHLQCKSQRQWTWTNCTIEASVAVAGCSSTQTIDQRWRGLAPLVWLHCNAMHCRLTLIGLDRSAGLVAVGKRLEFHVRTDWLMDECMHRLEWDSLVVFFIKSNFVRVHQKPQKQQNLLTFLPCKNGTPWLG